MSTLYTRRKAQRHAMTTQFQQDRQQLFDQPGLSWQGTRSAQHFLHGRQAAGNGNFGNLCTGIQQQLSNQKQQGKTDCI